ncbi:MAG: hypothetical protein ACQEQL_04115 [Pseudomonadota bacterium]
MVMRTENYQGSLDNEKVSIETYELLDYAVMIEQAVANLMLAHGCELTELSFDHPDRSNYNTAGHYLNPNSPSDKSCHIFDEAGGGVPYKEPSQISLEAGTTEYGVTSTFSVHGLGQDSDDVGDSGVELVFVTRVIESACNRINQEIGFTTDDPPSVTTAAAAFSSVLDEAESFPIAGGSEGMDLVFQLGDTEASALENQSTACYDYNGMVDVHYFYHVLLAR